MKAVMYHYVRPDNPDLPYFRHLHIDDFVAQLEYFGAEYGYVSREAFDRSIASATPTSGVVLTFDDGFSDHYSYVLPELLKRGLWGIFYVATAPYSTGKLLDVHRIHMLLGRHGGNVIADALRTIVTDALLSHAQVEEFNSETYKRQNNRAATSYVKRVLNYFIDYKYRESVIDKLMAVYCPNESDSVQNFYMTQAELADMHQNGMIVGSHSVTHPVMSKLAVHEQEKEIVSSFKTIEDLTGKNGVRTFCYPYGGYHSFTAETERLLERHSCSFSFNVESRDIVQRDLADRRQALPRFDSNAFPHGSCRHVD